MNLTQAINDFGTKLTGATIAGRNEQEALNKIATALSGSTCDATNWADAFVAMGAAVNGKSVVTLETKNITSNDTYNAASGKAWNKVVVAVESSPENV